MTNKITLSTAAVAITFSLLACNGDVTEVTEITNVTEVIGMKVIKTGEDLPECSIDHEGAMIYSTDSLKAYYCINKKWASLNGKDGADGKNGADGQNGHDGNSCTAELLPDSSGYKIICGEDSAGIVLNGEKGDKGDDGLKGNEGQKGNDGNSCTAKNLPDSSGYKIICGEDSVGVVLNGKDFKEIEGYLIDSRDGQIYKTVTIGTQTWMAENLNYSTEDGVCYNNDPIYCKTYGKLYYGGLKTICPIGWHIPDIDEIEILIEFAGGTSVAGKALKTINGWEEKKGSDDYGFSAFPAGMSYPNSHSIGVETNFWSSSIYSDNTFYHMQLTSADYTAEIKKGHISNAFSIRCIKD